MNKFVTKNAFIAKKTLKNCSNTMSANATTSGGASSILSRESVAIVGEELGLTLSNDIAGGV